MNDGPHPRSSPPPSAGQTYVEGSGAVVDDCARQDGGKTTDHRSVPPAQLDQIGRSAIEHTREEPGS